jgi:hypothetical protein
MPHWGVANLPVNPQVSSVIEFSHPTGDGFFGVERSPPESPLSPPVPVPAPAG